MRNVPIPIVLVAFLIASPVLIPIAMSLHARDQRRMRRAAGTTFCDDCDALLGMAALERAETVWAAHIKAVARDYPTMKWRRMVRNVRAICAGCGAEYGFDAARGAFSRCPE